MLLTIVARFALRVPPSWVIAMQLLLGMVLSQSVFAQPVQLANPGFESGTIGWVQDSWLTGLAVYYADSSNAHSGQVAGCINASSALNDVRYVQSVPVTGGTWYRLTAWVRTHDIQSDPAGGQGGANIGLLGTFTRSDFMVGTQGWTLQSLKFLADSAATEIQIDLRIGHHGAIAKGTACFDDVTFTALPPPRQCDTPPPWSFLLLMYNQTDFTWTDTTLNVTHRYQGSISPESATSIINVAREFVTHNVTRLSSGALQGTLDVYFASHPLSSMSWAPLDECAWGWWASWADVQADVVATGRQYDAVFSVFNDHTVDVTTGQSVSIACAAGWTPDQGLGTTYCNLLSWVAETTPNLFKHEFGHSILSYFRALGVTPKPDVSNHAEVTDYVNCHTGQQYIWVDEEPCCPIPNSIYNDLQGFTHDYYSGTVARSQNASACLGVGWEAWRWGGPVSSELCNAPISHTGASSSTSSPYVSSTATTAASSLTSASSSAPISSSPSSPSHSSSSSVASSASSRSLSGTGSQASTATGMPHTHTATHTATRTATQTRTHAQTHAQTGIKSLSPSLLSSSASRAPSSSPTHSSSSSSCSTTTPTSTSSTAAFTSLSRTSFSSSSPTASSTLTAAAVSTGTPSTLSFSSHSFSCGKTTHHHFRSHSSSSVSSASSSASLSQSLSHSSLSLSTASLSSSLSSHSSSTHSSSLLSSSSSSSSTSSSSPSSASSSSPSSTHTASLLPSSTATITSSVTQTEYSTSTGSPSVTDGTTGAHVTSSSGIGGTAHVTSTASLTRTSTATLTSTGTGPDAGNATRRTTSGGGGSSHTAAIAVGVGVGAFVLVFVAFVLVVLARKRPRGLESEQAEPRERQDLLPDAMGRGRP